MKRLILAMCLSLICVLGCATEDVETEYVSTSEQMLAPTRIDVRPLVRSTALAPILGVPPGSGGAFDPQLCTEYPSGCDPDTGACSYFPSGCGQGGGGSGGGGGDGGGGGGGGTVVCDPYLTVCSGYQCDLSYCGEGLFSHSGWETGTCTNYLMCSNGTTSQQTYPQSRFSPGVCDAQCGDPDIGW